MDHAGRIWAGTTSGASVFDPVTETWHTYTFAEGSAHNHIYALAVDHTGHIWAGHHGISVFDPTTEIWHTYTTADGLADNYAAALTVDNAGHVWAGAGDGVSVFDPTTETWRTYTMGDGLVNNYIHFLTADHAGRIWAGTLYSGVSVFDPTTEIWHTYTTVDGLAGDYTQALTVDLLGRVWVGTSSGLSVFTPATLLPVSPDTETHLYSAGTFSLTIPAGAVTTTTYLQHTPLTDISAPRPAALHFTGDAFRLTAYQAGLPLSALNFARPLTLTLHYSDTATTYLQDEASLTLQRWDESTATWYDAACGHYQRDRAANDLTVPLCTTGKFALFGSPQPPHTLALTTPSTLTVNTAIPLLTTLTPLTSTPPFTYTWYTGARAPVVHTHHATSDTLTLRWLYPGPQPITVTVANAFGHILTTTHTLTVNLASTNAVSISGPRATALSRATAFTATVSLGTLTLPDTFIWQASGYPTTWHTSTVQDTATFTWTLPTTGTLTLLGPDAMPRVVTVTVTARRHTLIYGSATHTVTLLTRSRYLPFIIHSIRH